MNAADTNIFFYALDPREPSKRAAARQFLDSTLDLVLPWQVLCELANGFRKLSDRGVPRREARRFLNDLLHDHPVLMPNLRALNTALDLQDRFSLSFWDANLVAACLVGSVTTLYTEDITAYPEIDGMKLVNPFVAAEAS